MSKFSVVAMVPIGLEVEAEDYEEAIEEFMCKSKEAVYYGGDGIFVTNLETGETYEG